MKVLILIFIGLGGFLSSQVSADPQLNIDRRFSEKQYICPPCAHQVDPRNGIYQHDGQCPVCGMNLIENNHFSAVEKIELHSGSGNFLLEGGDSHEEKLITVFYHRPEKFSKESPILIVLPGAGRNAWDYRDAWIAASERYKVLVISPAYAEKDYDFAAYHMGGVIENLELNNVKRTQNDPSPTEYRLKDEDIVFDVNREPNEWIFQDFDRIFATVAEATGSRRERYDIFGHSAGGQVLHRLVLFKPDSKASRILASNSGFYTLPDLTLPLPFGLKGTAVSKESLVTSFAQNLILFIGEMDNEAETGGTMLYTPSANQQGLHRLARGRYFFEEGRKEAIGLDAGFNWKLEIVKGIGHDYRRMGEAAARYLYGDRQG